MCENNNSNTDILYPTRKLYILTVRMGILLVDNLKKKDKLFFVINFQQYIVCCVMRRISMTLFEEVLDSTNRIKPKS